jgi:chromosome segregation ATPase
MQGVTPDGADPLLLKERRNSKRGPGSIPLITVPGERVVAPAASGELLGLKGTTATERLLQMRAVSLELERENEELRQQNAGLMSRLKESHEQLAAGVREIQMARKELSVARGDLDRLKTDLQNLREKVRIAEREYSGVLQSMGPLLQQLLESDDLTGLPPNPSE